MNNVFQNALPIAKQYDLKGSTQGRTSATDAPKPATILKDLDLDIKVKLEEGWHDRYYPVTFGWSLCLWNIHSASHAQITVQVKKRCASMEGR